MVVVSSEADSSSKTHHKHHQQQKQQQQQTRSMPFSVLDKLFGKRLLQARRYIMSRRSWLKMVPTDNCDILMTFPGMTALTTHSLLWLLNQIRVGDPQGAEQMGMHKPVKVQYGGGSRRFSCEEDNIYDNIESEMCFFTSQERQSIIRFWLDNLRAKHGEVLHNIHFLEGQPIIPELVARGVIHQMFPLHEQRILGQLMTSWVQAVCEKQPLGNDICCVVFALFNVVWATLFLERWKRREAELAYKWGTLDTPAESLEEPRPQFRGVKRCSPITGCEEFYYPSWKRALFRWLVSLPICLLCLCFVFLAMLLCLELQEVVMAIKELPGITRFLPKIVLAITVTVCDELYKKIAYWLNDMGERHSISFEFINSYLSLFYIGFYLKDMERLKEMLATLLIFRQFLQNVKEVLQPYLYEQNKLGVFTPQVLWELLQTIVVKYSRLALGKAHASMMAYSFLGPRGQPVTHGNAEMRKRGDLKAGFRLTEEEWDMSDALRQRKVCFTEKVDYQDVTSEAQAANEKSLEDSPTLDTKEMHSMSPPNGLSVGVHGRRTPTDGKEDKRSWIEPPAEPKGITLTQAQIESCMQTYEARPFSSCCPAEYFTHSNSLSTQDTLQDYQEMFIQFGYVVLFSSAFPLAAMCALINNIIEIRSDALKLCTGLQRPFGQRVESIGQWQTAMEAMGLIAIIVNCYLIGQCGQLQRLFPWLSPEMTIIFIVLLEHFAILLKYVIHVSVPDIPGWVADEMAKLEYRRREAFKVSSGKFSLGAHPASPAHVRPTPEREAKLARLPQLLSSSKSRAPRGEEETRHGTAAVAEGYGGDGVGGLGRDATRCPRRPGALHCPPTGHSVPGKLFGFSKSEGTVVVCQRVAAPQAGPAAGDASNPLPGSKAELNSSSFDELPSNDSDKGDGRPTQRTPFDNSASRG
ncbi:hypothetical protein CRUP_008647 [Coryphaenoides rupestris]|nr:hypothetical protein CRUP_008647 [Coryphaenoides rupestris]